MQCISVFCFCANQIIINIAQHPKNIYRPKYPFNAYIWIWIEDDDSGKVEEEQVEEVNVYFSFVSLNK